MTKKNRNDEYIKWPAAGNDLIKVMCWSGAESIVTHKHEFIEIAFVTYGSCNHTYHGSIARLIPGDVFIITPHEEHSYTINSKTVIYNCLFYPEALGEDWDRLREIKSVYDLLIVQPIYHFGPQQQEILHLEPAETAYLKSLLKKMLKEQDNKYAGFELMRKSYLSNLLCTLGRAWEKQLSESKIPNNSKRDMLAEALHFIESNMLSELKVEDIAERVYLSPSYFRKVFKEVTGMNPIEYINKIRISKACMLLADRDMTVSQVAETVGIFDSNYFSRLFKNIVGCSPSKFKRKSELY
jgi:AraC family L-rhamnose operon regulatory protein RhaS